MAFKFVIFAAVLAVANAGLINAPGHLAYTGGAAGSVHLSYATPTVQVVSVIPKVHAYATASFHPHTISSAHQESYGVPHPAPVYRAPIESKVVPVAPKVHAYSTTSFHPYTVPALPEIALGEPNPIYGAPVESKVVPVVPKVHAYTTTSFHPYTVSYTPDSSFADPYPAPIEKNFPYIAAAPVVNEDH